jgi:hypothetical protein
MSRAEINIEVTIEAEGHKRWAIARAGEVTFRERVPLHILALPQDDQLFYLNAIAKRLKKKVDTHFKNPLITHKTGSLEDDKASGTSAI